MVADSKDSDLSKWMEEMLLIKMVIEWRRSTLGAGGNQGFSLGHGTFEMPAK